MIQIVVVGVFAFMQLSSDPQLEVLPLVEALTENGAVLAIATCATTIACVGLVLLLVKLRKGAKVAQYLALSPISGKTLLQLLALTIGFVICMDGLTLLLGRPIIPEFMIDVYRTSVYPALIWLALVIAAPVFEEIFFRGFLFEGFRHSRLGNAGAIGLTALAFASIHLQYDGYDMAGVFVLGVLLGVMRLRTGSLWSPMLMHVLWNLVATIETALYVHGFVG